MAYSYRTKSVKERARIVMDLLKKSVLTPEDRVRLLNGIGTTEDWHQFPNVVFDNTTGLINLMGDDGGFRTTPIDNRDEFLRLCNNTPIYNDFTITKHRFV